MAIAALAVEAALTESLTSSPCLTASTYSFVANEFVPNPLLSLYPPGTVTVPVPCGVKLMLLLLAVVDIVAPSRVKLSTTSEASPDKAPPVKEAVPSDIVVNVPAAALEPPMMAPSIVPPLISAVVIVPRSDIVALDKSTVPVAVKFVKVPAPAEEAPIVVPSILPPLISKFEPSISTEPASNFLARVIFSAEFVESKVR